MDTRSEIMRLLLLNKEGLTTDELSERLNITRSAVQQHLANLERDGVVCEGSRRNSTTGGRPSRVFTLTEAGLERFPRQYALLSSRLVKGLKESVGGAALESIFDTVAEGIYAEHAHRVNNVSDKTRVERTADIMNELGYEATVLPDGSGISAVNCVFHQIARQVREVCHLDLQLLARLTGRGIDHVTCMADGDRACIFKIKDG